MALERIKGGWRVRIRYGAGLRGRFRLPDMPEKSARERALRLERMAARLAEAGKHVEAQFLLERAAKQLSDKDFAGVERAADVIIAEAVEAEQVTPKGPRTFRDVAELWLSGELHRRYPDDVPKKGQRSVDAARGIFSVIYPAIGELPVAEITLEDAERAKGLIPEGRVQGTRRHYATLIRRVLDLAEYPLRLIERSPIPRKFVPSEGQVRAFAFLYPSEDLQLMRCHDVPFGDRLLYGFLARNGMRVSEAAGLIWDDLDLERGVLTLDKNKTRQPRSWALAPDVTRALKHYRGTAEGEDVVFAEFSFDHVARRFRQHLKLAGIKRREIYAKTAERRPMRIHDLRGTFVTLALADGRTESWVMDRTGHTTSNMLAKYRRQARHAAEVGLGWFQDLDKALGIYPTLNLGQDLGHILRDSAGNPSWLTPSSSFSESDLIGQQPERADPEKSIPRAEEPGPAGISQVGQTDDPLLKVEEALALALEAAVKAGRLDLVNGLVAELAERRRARAGWTVPSLEAARDKKRKGES